MTLTERLKSQRYILLLLNTVLKYTDLSSGRDRLTRNQSPDYDQFSHFCHKVLCFPFKSDGIMMSPKARDFWEAGIETLLSLFVLQAGEKFVLGENVNNKKSFPLRRKEAGSKLLFAILLSKQTSNSKTRIPLHL
jgi:hypothetical protein